MDMMKDNAYREVEKKIKQARREGAPELSLRNMELTELPDSLGQLRKLKKLDIGGDSWKDEKNQLTALPETISSLTQLQSLDLSDNLLIDLPESLGQLTQLQSLNLYHNQLTELPESLCQLTQLQWLSLYDNQLTKLPVSLGRLTQLRTLKLTSNKLTELPEWIDRLIQLYSLTLSFNQLTELPESLGRLPQLHSLKLTSNKLTALPESLGQLTQLHTLYIDENHLNDLPKSIGNLLSLKYLNIEDNSCRRLPNSFANLNSLESFVFATNDLFELPEPLCSLITLKKLSLCGNKLTAIPNWIGELRTLEELELDGNKLKKLPETIGNLRKLTLLELGSSIFGGNMLTDLPPSLAQLENLKELKLHGNPLNPELAAAYEQGLDAVKAYLRAKADAQIILNEAKLILVGEGEVGKTSLLGALRGDTWVENRPTTHGVEVDIKTLKLTYPDSGKEVTLNGWDFGGQNIYRHTHQLFFTAPAVYLAVWNPRRGPEQCRVDEWIKMVKHRAYDETKPNERPRILVVATHGGPKERLDHIDEQALRDEFGDLIAGFLHVDSKPDPETGACHGMDELKGHIARTAERIPQVGRSVPASWKKVLDAVRERGETDAWITYEQFQTLCAEQEVSIELAGTYAAILNELGHLIHYSADAVLKDTVILKPEWLSKAISFVLEDKQVKEQNGLVTHDRLGELWDDPTRGADRYPKKLHPVFLKLMERFDLSYRIAMPIADAPATNLVAQLVPGGRSQGWEQDWVLKPGDTERKQVCRVLDAETGRTAEAEGLMYRLIVRLHRYSLGRNDYCLSRHWKTGMLLDDDFNGRAFVEEIAGDVHITVRAAYPERFLSHLCAEVQWLANYFWKGLDARLYVPCRTPSCKGLLEMEEIIENKAEGMPKIRCSVCRKYYMVDSLMATAAPKPEWRDAVTELKQGQQQILGAVDAGFDSLNVNLRTLMSQADEQFEALLTTLTDPAKDGPRLFSFEPVEPRFWDRPTWISLKFRLTLWCEHKRAPLPALNEDDETRGVYEIDLTQEWIKRAAPVLRVISATLRLTLPIAVPGTKLASDDTEYKAIDDQLQFGVNAADSFIGGGEKVGDWIATDDASNLDETRSAIRARGSVLRELHVILKKADPAGSFGGLQRVQNKRRQFLWVHPRFVDKY